MARAISVRAAKAAPADVIAFGGYNLDGVIQSLGDAPGDQERQRFITAITSIARAFHSQNFYARAGVRRSGRADVGLARPRRALLCGGAFIPVGRFSTHLRFG